MVVAIYRESTQSSKIGNADGGPQLGQTQTTGKSQLAEIVQGKNGCNVKNVLISVLRNPSGYIVEISVYVIPITQSRREIAYFVRGYGSSFRAGARQVSQVFVFVFILARF